MFLNSSQPLIKKGVLFLGALLFVCCLLIFVPCICKASSPLRVLVSGFEPFASHKVNPTQLLAQHIQSCTSQPDQSDLCRYLSAATALEVKGLTLPVTYDGAWPRLREALDKWRPDVVLAFGLAAGAETIRMERAAHNNNGGFKDNAGRVVSGKISPSGPARVESTLPLETLKNVLETKGFKAGISQSAGAYICNNVFYQLMKYTAHQPALLRAGFIHVPDMRLSGEHGLESALISILQTLKEKHLRFGVYEFEPTEDDVSDNLSRIEKIVKEMSSRGVDFHMFPEMALTGFIHDDLKSLLANNPELQSPDFMQRLGKLAATVKGYVAVGMPVYQDARWNNSYVVFFPDGTVGYKYDKNHLYGCDHEWSSPGCGDYPILSLPGVAAGVLICHDVVYDESFTEYIKRKVPLLLIGTNWIGNTSIFQYLKKNSSFDAILVSDRKGEEQGTHFPGNTGVLLSSGQILLPRELAPGIRGVLYLSM